MKPFTQKKILYSIKEVADEFGVKTSLLRYWEKEFDFIHPVKSAKGTRQYSGKDIENIRLVYHLVKEKGLTLTGAKQRLKDNGGQLANKESVILRLQNVLSELQDLEAAFGEITKQLPPA
ncbi:MAG: MerR family transcriptional regulator [Dysgonamonadaceae bacterium]|jgi:DNA-binding transcriptional MerR regulator|nr:MerR family transcriptional regulator [Dysgonamonadaceae bacterium]